MKDCCERDDATSRVTVGTGNQRALVERFLGKFIREAQMMAGMDHPHIVRVLDVFEENGTAYYVMDFLPGGSLADKVKKDGPLSEAKAEEYIRQVADALDYIHGQNTVHLDAKPSNILLNAKGESVLIDFGISKHYDDTGEQTSSTPVGISKGYAPLEQRRDGDVSQFGPSTDIYALGATLYYLVTGIAPPEASIVNEDGLTRPKVVSDRIWNALTRAMQPRRKDRPQDIDAFLSLLLGDFSQNQDVEKTIVKLSKSVLPNEPSKPKQESGHPSKTRKYGLWFSLIGIASAIIATMIILGLKQGKATRTEVFDNVVEISTPAADNMKKLYDVLSLEYDLGSFEEFANDTALESNRKKLFEAIKEDYEVGNTYDDFERSYFSAQNVINGHEFVDLGLSVKWATCNVGASSPEGRGDYFAWGETKPKNEYTSENYIFYKEYHEYTLEEPNSVVIDVTINKYNSDNENGPVDNKDCLDLIDDAAHCNWGQGWRMPTKTEFNELVKKCSWKWVEQGNMVGFVVKSKKNGHLYQKLDTASGL